MDKKIRILLSCGAGMSSGFLAQKMRQVAKKKGLDVKVEAKSESEVASYLPNIDVLLLGPHYASQLQEFTKMAQPYHAVVDVIDKDAYASLDGEAVLDFAINLLKLK